MIRYLKFAFSLLLLVSAISGQCQSVITYTVEPRVFDKTLHIRMDIPVAHQSTVRLQMPVWMPGAYFIGNFATNVSDVSAKDEEERILTVAHPDPNTWGISAHGAGTISVKYTLRGADLEQVDGIPKRGHISGPRAYMYVVGRKSEPVELDLITPAAAKTWKVATSLDPIETVAPTSESPPAVYQFSAPTYDVLADAPVEMGDFGELTFNAAGKPHRLVLYGDYSQMDHTLLVKYCTQIAETETAFFGGAPFARYVFEFRCSAVGRGGGGLEHLGSTEISINGPITDVTRSVIAHEYFHLWNVKRIRPFVLGPFNYIDPPHTANLWWSEGVTSYYGDLLSLRGGLNTRDEYLKHVAQTISQLQNNPGRLRITADQSSLRVWEANNSQGFGLDYYTKGELIGLCLDLKIRHETQGRVSLDNVIKALYTQCKFGRPGFQEDDIKKTINRVSEMDLSEFYDLTARSVEEMPFEACLEYAGLLLTRVEPPTLRGDVGFTGRPNRELQSLQATVTSGGAADKAGLKTGDRIVAINGSTELRGSLFILNRANPGDKITVTVADANARRDIVITAGSREVYSWTIAVNPAATIEQVRLRDKWLATK